MDSNDPVSYIGAPHKRATPQSVLEWNKHLSIVGRWLDVNPDGMPRPDCYTRPNGEHPVHENAIREFKTWR